MSYLRWKPLLVDFKVGQKIACETNNEGIGIRTAGRRAGMTIKVTKQLKGGFIAERMK